MTNRNDPTQYQVALRISLPDGSLDTLTIYDMYLHTRMLDDIDQTAWNMCGCKDDRQVREFGNLNLSTSTVKQIAGDSIEIIFQFSVISENIEFIRSVIDQFMDGYSDFMKSPIQEYVSRTGLIVGINPTPVSWDVDITKLLE